ncbi:MAG: small conductance mechanosensitive channel [Maricaulis maris]|jgi:small conductance mechanosensitive channel|uniref:Small-conductance mechanosensitive channel n=1 Tax=Maricaulis maris (strain MCS10) TaxID=394221 RepID=Q0ASB7_MARMM|nr:MULTISPECIES: mechanosensitive ion channel domain-containing protein [Maricaulis]ABI64820.1 MscS Mechanosensitive ion channel [Maricaulis maris MCS10]MAC88294.1 mechanosensitive ion channel protein MscS [Maricaulis sp.]
MNPEDLMNPETLATMVEMGIAASTNVVLAAIILIIGLFIAGSVRKAIRTAVHKSATMDDTLGGFFGSLAYYGIMAMVVIAMMGTFGIPTTSFVATLGAASLAIGLALQGTLSNLAAGVMLILFRPYRLGEFVEVAGTAGVVKEITLFTTVLATGDNKKIIIPNSKSWGDTITNYSANPTRRVDLTFSIDYSDDIGKAMQVIQDTIGADERVHSEPAIFTAVSAHGESSVDIVTRAWCNSGDYWGVHFDAMKNVKEAFDANGISIPYPHRVNIARKA